MCIISCFVVIVTSDRALLKFTMVPVNFDWFGREMYEKQMQMISDFSQNACHWWFVMADGDANM